MKVAIIHDWLIGMGGAEKVIWELHELFPDAPIYTSVVNIGKLDNKFRNLTIIPTFIQNLPLSKKKYNRYLPLFPVAFESIDLRGFDLIISSSSSVGVKGVLRDSDSVHICYCHTPPRYIWDFYHEYFESAGRITKFFMPMLMHYLRQYDFSSSQRVDHFIANSNYISKRIEKVYRRQSTVIFPPVDTSKFKLSNQKEEFFIMVGRLVKYKRFDIGIEACNRLKKKLIIIGDGEEREYLQSIAGDTISFLGFQDDKTVEDYLTRAKGFLFPGKEDFGIAPVEAQAAGTPVVGLGQGGLLDTVINGITGILFNDQTVESMVRAIEKFDEIEFDSKIIREHAIQFDKKNFKERIQEFIIKNY